MAVNVVTIDGHAARDAQTRTVGKQDLAAFSVAHERRWKEGEEWKGETFFIDVNAWSGAAKRAGGVRKGDRVLVFGRLNLRKWKDKDGNERVSTEIIASEVYILSAKAERPARSATHPSNNTRDDDPLDDEIPF